MATKNKIISFVLLMLVAGCSRDETQAWRKFVSDSRSHRVPAQVQEDHQGKCFKDRFDLAEIQDEVKQTEQNQNNGKAMDLVVKNLAFRSLPRPAWAALTQNTFIDATISPYWFSFLPTHATCTTLSCFADQLYTNPNGEGALYAWYVYKTGYAISTLDAYPWFVRDNSPSGGSIVTTRIAGKRYSDFLFSHDELKALWFQANLLPKTLMHLPDLSTIHRLPKNYLPDAWKESGSCACAVGSWSQGIVLLSDECLTLDSKNIFNQNQYFYISTTHEYGHRISAWNFASSAYGPDRDLDQDPEFLALSGWEEHTLVTDSGQSKTQWVSKKDAKFVTAYASSNPAEDFAETVGYYRTTASEEYTSTPEKYEYIKNKIFEGKGYTSDDLSSRYSDIIRDVVVDSLSDWSAGCLAGKNSAPINDPYFVGLSKVLQIDLPLDDAIKVCLQNEVSKQIKVAANEIRYDEPEGCDHLNVHAGEVLKASAVKAVPLILNLFKNSAQIADLLKVVQALRTSVQNEFDGRALFLSCLSEKSPQNCYQTGLATETKRLFEKYKTLLTGATLDLVDQEKARFINGNSYPVVSDQVLTFYKGISDHYNSDMDSRAQKIWDDCSSQYSNDPSTDLVSEPYHGGANTIPPAVLKCINQTVVGALSDLQIQIAKGEGFDYFSPAASAWLQKSVIFLRFKSVFDRGAQMLAQEEAKKLDAIRVNVVFAIASELKNSPPTSCKASAVQKLIERIRPQTYHYMSLDPIFDSMGNSICDHLRIAQGDKTPIDEPTAPSVEQKKDLDSVWEEMKSSILISAVDRYKKCTKKSYVGPMGKRYCLFTERVTDNQGQKSSWEWIMEKTLPVWVKNAKTQNLAALRGYSDDQMMEIARERLQDERQSFTDLIYNDFSRKAVSN